ncbi:uncharacterized protein Z518_05545 [Rhinocladiella mackenziei CBS 650.93]|uniref:SPX domain-containing protein n=1 Tax=Rhinocladiella mackenziei CBS 650.93 TaxID=1442369 RepID=A0A0D2J6K5_9EURO|nr:uncharacterized protein Z518_05545 [Rhinocladiella mackenziei CBS 650.93]KIX04675.1 hypothetical protein Z518_05545 [Rhinocladiella mackenziei CBS 650.93]
MKFGETLYQRSVPKWAAYNFKYNEIKHLIKNKTSAGVAVPVDIPTQGKSRWEELDNQLFKVLQAEYDNVTLFLRSKQGEIERRLAHLEKQIRTAQRAVEDHAFDKPIMQARKYQQLVRDTEDIGDEIQNLSRFAAVQKTAFRKILKKYRKWTGSTSLQTRLDVEVFSSKKLQTDFSDYLQQLAEQSAILTEELAGPMLTGRPRERSADRQQKRISASAKRSAVTQINDAVLRGPLAFDAAVLTVPYGEAAGSAFYWIHPDNLDEARTLLLRHMRDGSVPSTPSRRDSGNWDGTRKRLMSFSGPSSALVHMVVFDNAHRFVKDFGTSRPSQIALSGHWSYNPEAVVTLAGLSPTSSGGTILTLDRKDLAGALQRESLASNVSNEIRAIQHYLTEHRDVKPLAEVCTNRTRYVGLTNTAEVANWATLDTSVTVMPVDMQQLGRRRFPIRYSHIRWEFARTPAVVRAFDESHLVERVYDFTLEGMAIHTAQKDLPPASWHPLLEKDIRKVPIVPRVSRPGTANRTRVSASDVAGTSSGPSSSDGPTDSVFSVAARGYSSVTSDDIGVTGEASLQMASKGAPNKNRRRKRARIKVPERDPTPIRYWNEFDDGDSDANPEEGYAIYVDPNEPAFPGAETVSKAFGVMYNSLCKGTSRVLSWLPLASAPTGQKSSSERTPLLADQQTGDGDPESSDSDTDELIVPQPHKHKKSRPNSYSSKTPGSLPHRPHQLLSPRQRSLERTLFFFYSGLLVISYILLGMSAILLGTGRKKAFIEVDAGVLGGVITAEICAVTAMILILMRKQILSVVHWGIVAVAVASVVVVGVAQLALMFAGAKSSTGGKVDVDPHKGMKSFFGL